MNNEFTSENISRNNYDINPIGPRLRNAREALRLTVADIARQLRLKSECIEALEDDQYEQMPGATFAKGYLRAYAKIVNLSGDELIADFDRLKLMPTQPSLILPVEKRTFLLKQKPIRLAALTGIGLLLLIAIWWNLSSDKENTPALHTQSSAVLPQATPTAQPAVQPAQNNTAPNQALPQSAEKQANAQPAKPLENTSADAAKAPGAATTESSTAATLETQSSAGADENATANDETDAPKKSAKKSRRARVIEADPFDD